MPRFIAIFSSHPESTLSIAQRLSPRLEIYPPKGLVWEVLSRREEESLDRLLRSITLGSIKYGIASTRIAALLTAEARPGNSIPAGQEQNFLAPLPVNLLFSYTQKPAHPLLTLFARWGIRSLGDLAALPRTELAARLGQSGISLQKMACGEDIQPFQSYVVKPHFEEHQELDWSMESLEALAFILAGMLDRLCTRLESHGLAAESLTVVLKLLNHPPYERTLGLAFPIHNAKILLSLIRLKLRSHPPQAAILGISLRVKSAPPQVFQYSLFHPSVPNPEKLSRTLARLTTLIGEDRIGSPILLDTHRPDAFRMGPLHLKQRSNPSYSLTPQDRQSSTNQRYPFQSMSQLSLRRFRPPVPTDIRSQQIVSWAGPWRSSGDWWTETLTASKWSRDEWDIELTDGTICRVYWDYQKKAWFFDGIYD